MTQCVTKFFLDPESATANADVSILVTEPSPEVPVGPKINANQTLIHHVIVHRESEEYHDLDEVVTDQPSELLVFAYLKMFETVLLSSFLSFLYLG